MRHHFATNVVILLGFLLSLSDGLAQVASLTPDSPRLSLAGGEIALKASVTYREQPSAIGWIIRTPSSWAVVRVTGINPPQVSSETSSTGVQEFAYTTIPESSAHFTVIVRYPAGTDTTRIESEVIVRTNGKLNTLTLTPVVLPRS